ncbi:hypothetical protein ACA910_008081 [Epithemia clementina (nom. ined.)]
MTTTLRHSNTVSGSHQHTLADVHSRIKTTTRTTNGNNTSRAEVDVEEKKEETPHDLPPGPQQTATEKLAAGVIEARKSLIKVLMEHRFKQRFSSTALSLDNSINNRAANEMEESHQPPAPYHSPFQDHNRIDSGLLVVPSNSFASCSSDPKQQQQPENSTCAMEGEGSSSITREEREYLEKLILDGDVATIEAARDRLKDTTLFPTSEMMAASNELEAMAAAAAALPSLPPRHDGGDTANRAAARPPLSPKSSSNKREPPKRRDSKIQQKLFQIHQEKKVQPSRVLQYLKQNSILQSSDELIDSAAHEAEAGCTKTPDPTSVATLPKASLPMSFGEESTDNIKDFSENLDDRPDLADEKQDEQQAPLIPSVGSWNPMEDESEDHHPSHQEDEEDAPAQEEGDDNDEVRSCMEDSFTEVDPFKDISSWIDGGQGVEVNDSGIPLIGRSSSSASSARSVSNSKGTHPHHVGNNNDAENQASTSRPFRILGTSADDVSCHPHVLSPPLMESLLAFMPEGLMNCNYWIKYSLVRDGASMWTMMRKVRASNATVLAIETVDGHVFGAFTNQSWRFSVGWYGGQQAFLWKMRRSRLETTTSIFEQAVQESEVQVFPVRPGNVAVQYCSKDCLMLGRGEIKGHSSEKYGGKHYGHGIYLDSTLLRGTTSSSETFGNPCLVDDGERGTRFDVSNIEIWTLTPHDNVDEAQQSELSTMFLEGGREGDNLNLLGILVGGPI